MKVLGIDPGTRKVGYALLQQSKTAGIQCLASGTLELGDGEVLERLILLQQMISELIEKFKPEHIAFESLIYVKSPTTLIKLAMAKGVMLGVVASQYRDKIFEYKPNLVKQVVSGDGHADKNSMQKMVQLILKKQNFSSFDESDAISIALCHLMLYHTNSGHHLQARVKNQKRSGSLAASLAHKVKTTTKIIDKE